MTQARSTAFSHVQDASAGMQSIDGTNATTTAPMPVAPKPAATPEPTTSDVPFWRRKDDTAPLKPTFRQPSANWGNGKNVKEAESDAEYNPSTNDSSKSAHLFVEVEGGPLVASEANTRMYYLPQMASDPAFLPSTSSSSPSLTAPLRSVDVHNNPLLTPTWGKNSKSWAKIFDEERVEGDLRDRRMREGVREWNEGTKSWVRKDGRCRGLKWKPRQLTQKERRGLEWKAGQTEKEGE
ncbi:hypothetical protein P154DRAFT_572581 [Amniculicola lignicola CBS 123094]|uniref:Uncharacterized protein n=1 Tax=Amniculicola lignicola CBS 123094 TaxID=1392246 RepID=A0A6A5WVF8_9PLEO|nr:hypothetical protein P154DRAFT_572581 [Amniculicola lignicola CBS 123094]